ncbi:MULTISPECIES: pentapeptide repeat-containing protein [unclassified Anabaena]|uniref:pentapeptide repeat-containing protein n=1 Tax=unclassified Anabaena TaxID=2619674 RepID=UPI0006AC9142|nr:MULTISPECIES: pentapeptide repeat-containing protein [unclassified Anabaena]ALB40870.1 hypothetical protein AA650_10630 [Anabaena sp. WA102]OBQ15728.1 MAG: hypothetical protein AN486_21970 [Anabaena sp. AL93]
MSENNTKGFKSLLIILGIIFFIVLISIVLIFSFSDFAFLNPNGLTIHERLQYGIPAAQTTGTIVAGIAVFFNAYQASRSANAANENAKSVYKNAQAAEDKQITERFSKAIELLGNEKTEVKLGGIYALEQIAKDAPKKYHWTVMEVLTAFVRENAPLKKEEEGEKEEIPKLRTDIQAALTVIGRRNCEKYQGTQRLDLSNIDIRGAILSPEANLEGANFEQSNLQDADVRKANLKGAILAQAKLQRVFLQEAKLQGADFSEANLEMAHLDHANLQDAHLTEAKLQQANLNHANLQNAQFLEADLEDASLLKANLKNTDFETAILKNTDLREAILMGAKNLTLEQIKEAIGDEKTILPDYLDRPKCWKKSE